MPTNLHKKSGPRTIIQRALVAGGILLIGAVAPQQGARAVYSVIKKYIQNKKLNRHRFLQDVQRLQHKKLIDYQELENGTIKVVLTASGKKKALQYKLDDMKLKQGAWDGKWRLVMFDIPHRKKGSREAFRKKLQELGFCLLQKSVYISPWPCEQEIDFLCAVFEIPRSNILYFEIHRFGGDEKLKYRFHIT